MAVIITKEDTTFTGTNNFYRVEAYNLGGYNTSAGARGLSVATPRYQNVTFANAGSCLGVMCVLESAISSGVSATYSVQVSLEQYQTVGSFNGTTDKVNITGHGLNNNDIVSFTTTGTLPTNVTVNALFYVINKSTDDFQISTSLGGGAVNIGASSSGTHTCGVQRVVKILTADEIGGGTNAMTTYPNRGTFIVPFNFTAGYTVDTTASKWRIRFSYSGTGVGLWLLKTSDTTTATNIVYATWCDNLVSFNDNDVVIVKNYLTIDKSVTWNGVLGAGDTVYATAGMICSNSAAPETDTVCYLKWASSPAASYTFTIKGFVAVATFSGFRIGTELSPIPFTNKAIVSLQPPAVGTTTFGRFQGIGFAGATNQTTCAPSFFFYGEIGTYLYTTLSSNANTGQNIINTTDTTGWTISDKITIGKQDTSSNTTPTVHTISNIVGTEITLNANLSGSNRLAGGTVINHSRNGILFSGSTNTNHGIQSANIANLVLSGVDFQDAGYIQYNQGTTYYYMINYMPNDIAAQHKITDCTMLSTGAGLLICLTPLIPPKGILIERVYSHRQVLSYTAISYYTALHKSGRLEIKNCRVLCSGNTNGSQANNIRLTIENCYFENNSVTYPFYYMTGIDGIFKNNYLWGCSGGGGATATTSINCSAEGNIYNKGAYGNYLQGNIVNLRLINETYNDEADNTIDIIPIAGVYGNIDYKDCGTIKVIDTQYIVDSTVGFKMSFENYNNTAYDDKSYFTNGIIQRCKAGLSDTTVRTAGGSSMRFENNTADEFCWSFDVPTGSIQNKTLTVSVWVKINNASYYSSSYILPKLSITYDTDTVEYIQSTATTDWQLVVLPIMPITTSGKIVVSLCSYTDQTGSNAYVYFDDMSINYPAGYQLNLGSLDDWIEGTPITPPINIASDKITFIDLGGNVYKQINNKMIMKL
jgi:hypothetical protein